MAYPRTRPSRPPDGEESDGTRGARAVGEAKHVERPATSTESAEIPVEAVEAEISVEAEPAVETKKAAEDAVMLRSLPYREMLFYGLLALPLLWMAFALTTELGRLLALWVGMFALVLVLPFAVIRLLSR